MTGPQSSLGGLLSRGHCVLDTTQASLGSTEPCGPEPWPVRPGLVKATRPQTAHRESMGHVRPGREDVAAAFTLRSNAG